MDCDGHVRSSKYRLEIIELDRVKRMSLGGSYPPYVWAALRGRLLNEFVPLLRVFCDESLQLGEIQILVT